MFDNVEQLEKEIQEFRNNILASEDLLQRLNRIAEETQKEREALNASTNQLLQKMELQAQSMKQSTDRTITEQVARFSLQSQEAVDEAVERLQESGREMQQEVHNEGMAFVEKANQILTDIRASGDAAQQKMQDQQQSFTENVNQIMTRLNSSAENTQNAIENERQAFSQSIAQTLEQIQGAEKKHSATADGITQTLKTSLDKTQRFWDETQKKYAELTESLIAEHRAIAVEYGKAVEQAQTEYLSRVDEAYSGMIEQFAKQEESIAERQNALDKRIDEVLTLISKDKTEEIVNLCRQMEKNTNTKFIVLLAGLACVLVAIIFAYLK